MDWCILMEEKVRAVKWQKLGIPYPLPDAVPPTPEQVKRAEELLQVQRYPG